MPAENDYVPIPCADYETLETACMDGYTVELATRDGRTVVGRAFDLDVRPLEEFFVVLRDDGNRESIRADRIHHMTVLSHPRRFDDHTLALAAGD
jgi:transcriptional antiterminator Rof (Rho-off)